MTAPKKPLGLLIMILALVLVAVILVIVIVASSGDDDTTAASTTTTPTSTTTEPVGTTEAPTSSTETPTSSSTPTTTQKPVEPVKPTLTEDTKKADESGKVTLPSADAAIGSLILVDSDNPYKYDLENIFKGDHETAGEVIEKSGYDRIVSMGNIVTTDWKQYVRKETYTAMKAMLTTFTSHAGKEKAVQAYGYAATLADKTTNPFITGYAINLRGYTTGAVGLNYGLNKVTVDGESFTYDKWFEKYAASYGFVYEGLIGNENLKNADLRYVGSIHAAGVTAAGGLKAYLAGIKAGTITTATAADGSTWTLSYVAAAAGETTEITVGAGATYTVSGDNMGGFIVAVLAPKAN